MQKKDPGTKLIRAVRGPVRAPTFMRVTTRWDYEKSHCRDWKECGYCVYGDCCKYIHDRTDLKHGWELEDKWIADNGIVDSDNDYTVSSADEDEDLPFKCFICRGSYEEPIETLCKHYFCLKCAMKQYSKTMKCFICNKNTKGVFNPAKRITARIDRMANDGIDMDEKQAAFGEDQPNKYNDGIIIGGKAKPEAKRSNGDSSPELSVSEEEDQTPGQSKVQSSKPKYEHRAFITPGKDVNITEEEEIENEVEIENMLMEKFGAGQDESKVDDEDNSDEENDNQNVDTDLVGDNLKNMPGEDGDKKKSKKEVQISAKFMKNLIADAEKREKRQEFNENLGSFLPKAGFGHQTTEAFSFLKRFRKVTKHEEGHGFTDETVPKHYNVDKMDNKDL